MDILVKPEQLRQTAKSLSESAKRISKGIQLIDETMQSVGPAQFSGYQADSIRNRYQSIRERLLSSYIVVARFSAELEKIARQFEDVDREVAQGEKADKFGASSQKFNWYKTGSEIAKKTLAYGLIVLRKIPNDSAIRGSWKGLGRYLNSLIGKKKAGWVRTMDRLGHIIKNKTVQKVVKTGGAFSLGVIGDLLEGDRWDRAIGSEAIEVAAETSLPILIGGAVGGIIGSFFGGAGAVPGAVIGAKIGVGVYAAYQSALVAGIIFSGGLQIAGATKDAIWLQNTMDRVEGGEGIVDELYDRIYNRVTGRVPQ